MRSNLPVVDHVERDILHAVFNCSFECIDQISGAFHNHEIYIGVEADVSSSERTKNHHFNAASGQNPNCLCRPLNGSNLSRQQFVILCHSHYDTAVCLGSNGRQATIRLFTRNSQKTLLVVYFIIGADGSLVWFGNICCFHEAMSCQKISTSFIASSVLNATMSGPRRFP